MCVCVFLCYFCFFVFFFLYSHLCQSPLDLPPSYTNTHIHAHTPKHRYQLQNPLKAFDPAEMWSSPFLSLTPSLSLSVRSRIKTCSLTSAALLIGKSLPVSCIKNLKEIDGGEKERFGHGRVSTCMYRRRIQIVLVCDSCLL